MRNAIKAVLACLGALTLASCSQGATEDPASWPTRQIDVIVYSSPGGATDLTNRVLAEEMSKTLGVEVAVSNMPGAFGGAGVTYVWNQPHDGYRLAGISESALGLAPLGLIESTAKDWDWFFLGGTPGAISVRADSPYEDFASLLAAVRANPDGLKIAPSVPGGIWHIQWLNTKRLTDFETRFVPFQGTQPSLVAALSGEVDIVWTGLGEQSELIEGGRLRPLAVFSTQPASIAGESVPPITDFMPELAEVMPIDQFVGFAVAADTPEPVKAKLAEAFDAAMQSEAIAAYMADRFITPSGLRGEEAKSLALAQEQIFVATLVEAGLAQRDAEALGIAAP